jgi:hypothetical protein
MIITNLLANMVVLTLHSTIPTNTPAFQEYAFREMFGQSSNMIVSWNLDLPRPIWPCIDLVDSVGVTHETWFNWIES